MKYKEDPQFVLPWIPRTRLKGRHVIVSEAIIHILVTLTTTWGPQTCAKFMERDRYETKYPPHTLTGWIEEWRGGWVKKGKTGQAWRKRKYLSSKVSSCDIGSGTALRCPWIEVPENYIRHLCEILPKRLWQTDSAVATFPVGMRSLWLWQLGQHGTGQGHCTTNSTKEVTQPPLNPDKQKNTAGQLLAPLPLPNSCARNLHSLNGLKGHQCNRRSLPNPFLSHVGKSSL